MNFINKISFMRKNGDNDDESLKTLSDTTMVYGGVDLEKKQKCEDM